MQDVFFSGLALIVLSTIMLLTALIVYIEIHTVVRFLVKYGVAEPFKVYKFRSMYCDVEERLKDFLKDNEMDGPAFKIKDDPREVEQYNKLQMQRMYIQPGLACYWQTQSNRNDITFDEWMALDLKYIEARSFWVDWKIIFLTVKAMVFSHGR